MDEKAKRPGWSRRSMLAGAAAGLVTPLVVNGSAAPFSVEAAAQARGKLRQVTIYAEPVADGLVGYGLAPGQATIPGPLLEIYEGDTLEIELVNNTDQRLSIHPHGVDYDTSSDGSPLNASFNEPGETKVYTWRTRVARKAGGWWLPGSAGYWHYHDHAMGDHGTTGIAKGLYGGLIVRKVGDPLPDKQFTVVFNEMSINNKMAPDTPMFEANHGQRVEFVCVGHGNQLHTFHLHAHRWADTRTGLLGAGDDVHTRAIDNKDLNPGGSFGFQVVAGDGVGPGVWMYHCHVQFHADGGMVGLFLVRNPDGSMPAGAQEAIDRFQEHQHTVAEQKSTSEHSGHR